MVNSCGACKALVIDQCTLGHKIEVTKRVMDVAVRFRPVSRECQKPKNNDELCYLLLSKTSVA